MPFEIKPPLGKVGKRWLQSQIKTATSVNSKRDVHHCSYIKDSVHISSLFDSKVSHNNISRKYFIKKISKWPKGIKRSEGNWIVLKRNVSKVDRYMNHFHSSDFSLGTYLVDENQICKQVFLRVQNIINVKQK